jgi:hypothetical protein
MREITIANTKIYKKDFEENKFPDFAEDWIYLTYIWKNDNGEHKVTL